MVAGGTGCGTRSKSIQTGTAAMADRMGHPVFSGGGADRRPDAGELRPLCAGLPRRGRGGVGMCVVYGLFVRGRGDVFGLCFIIIDAISILVISLLNLSISS